MEPPAAASGLVEIGKRLVQPVSLHTADVRIEALVEGLVQVPPDGIGALFVHVLRDAEQVNRCRQDFYTDRQLCFGGVQRSFDPQAFVLDFSEPGLDPGLGERLVTGEVKQPLFLGVQLLELLPHAGVHFAHVGLLDGEAGVQHVTNFGLEPGGKFQRGVMVDNRLFDLITGKVGQVAFALLASAAQEVAVARAGLAPRLGVDQARRSSGGLAAVAEQAALEVMLQHAVTLAQAAAEVHNVLRPVEQLLRHDGLVPAGVQLLLVQNPAGVIGVLEHLVKAFEGHDTQTSSRTGTIMKKHNALARRLLDRQHDYLRFTTNWAVPPDNNGSERDIRMIKLREKVSGCLRSLTGAQQFAAIRSYLSTAAKHGLHFFETLVMLAEGRPWLPA